jgi:predicted dehydrogenase
MNYSKIAGHFNRRDFIKTCALAGVSLGIGKAKPLAGATSDRKIRIGIIGLSVHSADFTDIINGNSGDSELADCRVVAIYHPPGNEDVEFSPEQLSRFTKSIERQGVKFVNSIEAVLDRSDAIMLLTNDGRPHLQEAMPVFEAGKPIYIDKPLAHDLVNVKAIFRAADQHNVPVFSCSALRYNDKAQESRKAIGQVLGADAYGPCPLEKSHVDLFWDGIHGVETLYSFLGSGCQSVTRTYTEGTDVVAGVWKDGRTGVFRGLRQGKVAFGGTIYGAEGIVPIGSFGGYRPLVVAIADFFRTGVSPVSMEETLEIYAFMEAADESKRKGGVPVTLSSLLKSVGH